MSTRITENNKNAVNDPSSDQDGDTRLNVGEDDENMVSSSKGMPGQGYRFEASSIMHNREKHLRYRTRVFAAEYVMSFLYFFIHEVYISIPLTLHTQRHLCMHILAYVHSVSLRMK
jgi:hypothetical protein